MRMIVRCFAANDWSASAQFSPPSVTMTATFSELSGPDFTCLFEQKFRVTQIRQPELLLNKCILAIQYVKEAKDWRISL